MVIGEERMLLLRQLSVHYPIKPGYLWLKFAKIVSRATDFFFSACAVIPKAAIALSTRFHRRSWYLEHVLGNRSHPQTVPRARY